MLFDHEMEDCPILIARICDKGALPPPSTQNLQMMRSELREEDPNVNIVLKSRIVIGDDKGKQSEESAWVFKAHTKEPEFYLKCTKDTLMEAKKIFTEVPT